MKMQGIDVGPSGQSTMKDQDLKKVVAAVVCVPHGTVHRTRRPEGCPLGVWPSSADREFDLPQFGFVIGGLDKEFGSARVVQPAQDCRPSWSPKDMGSLGKVIITAGASS